MEANVQTQVETNWDLIPSDPDIFNDMLREYGINEMAIKEAYNVSFEEFTEKDSPVYGIIFTSRYEEHELPEDIKEKDPDADNIVFTSQIITNACATLALLAIVLNVDIEKGEIIDNFKNFTEKFTPVNRGIALGNSPQIRKIHNSYGVAEKKADEAFQNYAFQSTDDDDAESFVDDDNFHFISYIVKNGYIWELDGMKSRPLKLAAVVEGQHWLHTLSPFLQQKMNDDMQFSILVATSNELTDMKKSLEKYTAELRDIEDKLKEMNNSTEEANKGLLLQQQQQQQQQPEPKIEHQLCPEEESQLQPQAVQVQELQQKEEVYPQSQPKQLLQKDEESQLQQEEKPYEMEDMLVDMESRKRKSHREDEDGNEEEVQKERVEKSDGIIQHVNKKQKKQQDISLEENPITTIASVTSGTPSSSTTTTTMAKLLEKKAEIVNSINELNKEVSKKETQLQFDVSEMARQKFDYFPFINALIRAVKEQNTIPSSSLPPSPSSSSCSSLSSSPSP